jgi:hypothetical protein
MAQSSALNEQQHRANELSRKSGRYVLYNELIGR